ncbi:MAG: cell division protein FtsL [Legionellaceae bacterium]|nr:cell division protein FtsL [Legionellaceae bacterium]
MNAAARVIHQSNFFTGHLSEVRLTFGQFFILFLLSVVLCNALAIIYTTNINRTMFNQIQGEFQRNHSLLVEQGQLMLEKASLAAPARVEAVAEQKLGMFLPAQHAIHLIESP